MGRTTTLLPSRPFLARPDGSTTMTEINRDAVARYGEYVLIVPLRFNSGERVPTALRQRIEGMLLDRFDGFSADRNIDGAWRNEVGVEEELVVPALEDARAFGGLADRPGAGRAGAALGQLRDHCASGEVGEGHRAGGESDGTGEVRLDLLCRGVLEVEVPFGRLDRLLRVDRRRGDDLRRGEEAARFEGFGDGDNDPARTTGARLRTLVRLLFSGRLV